MTSKSIATEEWTCFYDAVNQLSAVRKNSQLVSEYGYDGDGKRVWAIDYESSVAQKETIYIGNYFEFVREDEAAGQGEGAICESPDYCSYLPMIFQMPRGVSYYYADGQRIAMRDKDGVVSYLYGDQLGSVSAVADASGSLESRTLYEPWGTTRHRQGTSPTDYGYTGQMQEGDIYFYQSRWYDPAIGRFMQADTLVPLQVQGTQAFDRYAYVNNNPLRYTDPSGNWMCSDQYELSCAESYSEIMRFGQMHMKTTGLPFSYVLSGSYDFGLGKASPLNRYSDDVISPTVPSGHPVTNALMFIDLAVRLMEEFKPTQKYVPKDDLYWSVNITASENEMELTRFSFWVPEETIAIRTIEFRMSDSIRRTQLSINEVLVGPRSYSVDMRYRTSDPMLLLTFTVTCYGCMTGSYYKDSFTPSVSNSPRMYIFQLPQ